MAPIARKQSRFRRAGYLIISRAASVQPGDDELFALFITFSAWPTFASLTTLQE